MIGTGSKYLIPPGPNEAVDRHHASVNLWVALAVSSNKKRCKLCWEAVAVIVFYERRRRKKLRTRPRKRFLQ